MPEGHVVHRLARAFDELFGGQSLRVSSPQGRFEHGSALIDGFVLRESRAHGKQLFLGFSPLEGPSEPVLIMRVHLGMYGSWIFDGDASFTSPHSIGAPRRRVGERQRDYGEAAGEGGWVVPEPVGQVRARLRGAHGIADLSGPTACEVITPAQAEEVRRRLGPDPLAPDTPAKENRERFVQTVRSRGRRVGEMLMDQSVIAGVGNIYRAEALYRARVHPNRPGNSVSAVKLRQIWDDLVMLMEDGARIGKIITTDPADLAPGVPGEDDDGRYYVYQRQNLPCRRCGAKVKLEMMAARKLYWCNRCQRAR